MTKNPTENKLAIHWGWSGKALKIMTKNPTKNHNLLYTLVRCYPNENWCVCSSVRVRFCEGAEEGSPREFSVSVH